MRRLKRVLKLSPDELAILAQAAICMPIVRLALRFISVARLNAMATRSRRQLFRVDAKPKDLARLVSIAADHGIYRARCLEKSLVLRWLLARRGIDGQVVFGACKAEDAMQAHAWIEVNGVPLNEDGGAHLDFARFEQRQTFESQ